MTRITADDARALLAGGLRSTAMISGAAGVGRIAERLAAEVVALAGELAAARAQLAGLREAVLWERSAAIARAATLRLEREARDQPARLYGDKAAERAWGEAHDRDVLARVELEAARASLRRALDGGDHA